MNISDLKQYADVKNLIRACSLAALLFFFVPAFTVSCSGQSEGVSASRIMTGISYDGTWIVPAQPALLLLLLLPAVIFAVWYIRRLNRRHCLCVCICCSLADFIGWLFLYFRCKEMESYGFTVKAAPAYAADLLLPAVIFAMCMLVWTGRLAPEDTLTEILPESSRRILPARGGTAPGWICPSCGRKNEESHAFCTGCGMERSSLPRCPACGQVLKEEALFCAHCGKKLSEG